MTDAWPVTLPQCLNVGYSEGLADNLIETQPDAGPPISRRRSTAGVRPLSGQMKMTRAQIATLKTFVHTTLMEGALPFTFDDPTATGGTLLVKFVKGSLPSWQQIGGGVYMVSISLTVLP